MTSKPSVQMPKEQTSEVDAAQSEIWGRLKSETRAIHEKLDARIMQGRPFESVERYGRFLLVQHDFHALVSPLYQSEELATLLPDLRSRDRLSRIAQDLADLGIERPDGVLREPVKADRSTALGWLYVAEGSNLGAAFLLKAAQKLGLSEERGARHLGGATEGRGLHWRTFTTALDAISLSSEEADRVVEGARDAFSTVLLAVEQRFFIDPA